uniref:Ribosomal protein S16 n=1 Tax=Chamaecyparis hodginsii TaxID=89191 RepID=A0A1U7EGJ5_9CONI|nr:ribosomal protein S16 [Chamaecyparis hodginsii]UFP91846.1 ribosomal protein S16 [Chamaecyparis hodginsii]
MIKIRLKRCSKKQQFLKLGTQLTETVHGIFLQKLIVLNAL